MSRSYVKVRVKNVSLIATICIAILAIFSYHSLVKLGGTRVTIQNVTEFSEASVSLRGGMNGDTWYNVSDIVENGNWTYNNEERVYTSTNDEVLVLKIPPVKYFNLVFNAGPNEGKVQITIGDDTYLCDLYQDNENEYGYSFSLQGLQRNFIIANTVSALLCLIIFIICIYLAAVYEEKKSLINWNIVEKAFVILLLPIVIFVLYFLSLSSTPRIPESACFWGYDGAVYNLIGKSWTEGLIPYKDIFEHKGPGAFFIFMLANLISEHWGVYVLQCICLAVSLMFSYKIGKLFSGVVGGMMASLASVVYFIAVIDEGGLLEEFNLPLLMISCYLVLKYAMNLSSQVQHPWKYAVVYGITFGVSLDLRVTNAVSTCAFVACITIFLLYKKEFQNLLHNAGGFLLGFAVVTLPFIIYFAYHGALYDMLYGTILFNLDYAGDAISHSKEEWKQIFVYLIPVISACLLAIGKKGMVRYTILSGAILSGIMMIRSYLYPHYYIIIAIFVPVTIGLWMSSEHKKIKDLNRYIISYFAICIVLIMTVFIQSYQNGLEKYNWIKDLSRYNPEIQDIDRIREQASIIPEEDRDKVIGYNIRASWYLVTGIYPSYKYYGGNDYLYAISDELRDETVQYYSSLDAEWIVVQSDIGDEEIREIINTNYKMVDEIDITNGNFKMFLYQKI
ncbi:ArnT family glycosyltransferase [Agathobaculum sp. LCP25S3_E8]|uniref:ArnT family glycosyltransferase n=1 Tax=Agathobaculum sp. LCP25S3_E8 TaxID=3438735 RepID=UPI003F912F25